MNKAGIVIVAILGIGAYCFNDMYQDVFVKPAKKEQLINQCAQSRMGTTTTNDPGYNMLFAVNHANCEFEMMK